MKPLTETELIAQLARQAQLTQDAAGRAYRALQALLQEHSEQTAALLLKDKNLSTLSDPASRLHADNFAFAVNP